MNKKNVIIISVLVNAGLLLVLFISALTSSKEESPVATKEPAYGTTNQMLGETAPIVSSVNAMPQQVALSQSTEPSPANATNNVAEKIASNGEKVQELPFPQIATTAPVVAQGQIAEDIVHKLPVPEESVQEVAASAVSDNVEVKVKKGDSLEKIAKKHRVTVSELIKLNHLPNTFLRVGQVLLVPQADGGAKISQVNKVAPAKKGEYYTVRCGDNLWTIALRHKVKTNELLRLNHMTAADARKLKPGMKLRIR